MKPNAVSGATARLAASLAVLVATMAHPALAGDRALFEVLGYSDDGRYFAFEEYGIQDGSGFPYANIYLIDLPADRWMSGTPARVLLQDDESALWQARERARQEVASRLDEFAVREPGHLIALNGDGEPGDGRSLEFGAVGFLPYQVRGHYVLTLETFEADTPDDCALYLGEEAKGFALRLSGEGADRVLHRDTGTLPRSRGCPMDYRVYGVVAQPDTGSIDNGVAIISVYPFGFEGPDRRFLAIPLGR